MKKAVILCNVSNMPIFEGKRLEFVGVKFNESEKSQFEKIGEEQDRAMSYVVRELALRGLVLYLQDHRLKTSPEEIETARMLLDDIDGKQLAPTSTAPTPEAVTKTPKAA